jgi:polyisoprenoid-binding protein YceI
MSRALCARLAALLWLGATIMAPLHAQTSAAAPTYALDPTHSFVHWEVVHMSTSTLRGRFGGTSGSVTFDAKARQIDIGITIDTSSVNTGVAPLDSLLRGASGFASTDFPQAFFTARSARWEGEVPREIRGEFTLRGVSQGLTLKAVRWKCGLNPLFRREVCGGDFEGEIVRSSFGITHSLPFVADKVRLLVQVEGIRQ